MKESARPSRIVSPVRVPGPAGTLEGLWSHPGRALTPAVLCHPHPAHGGSMHSKVVYTVYRVLEERGHPTLRFNFRGVGSSEGEHSGWNEEKGDVAAAAAFAREQTGSRTLWVAGFSFGAWIGLQWALEDHGVERFIALGLPVANHEFDFLNRVPWPLTVVQGEHDRYGRPADLERLREKLPSDAPVRIRIVPGADHFFTGKLEPLRQALEEIL